MKNLNMNDEWNIDVTLDDQLIKVMNRLPFGVMVIDSHARISWLNNAVPAFFKFKGDPAAFPGLNELGISDIQGQSTQLFQQILDGEILSLSLVKEYRKFDDTTFWAQVQATRINRPDDFIILLFIHNLSDSQIIEDKLFESETKYRTLVENSDDAIVRFDRNMKHLYVSPNVAEISGTPLNNFLGKTHREIGFDDEVCDYWESHLQEVLTTGEMLEDEFYTEIPGGSMLFNIRFIPEKDSDGNIGTILSISRDITEHRKTEQDYSQLFDSMLNAFALHEIIVDDDGTPVDYRFLRINKKFQEMTGLKEEDVIGKTVMEIMPQTEEFWIKEFGQVALLGESKIFENFSSGLNKYFEVHAYSPRKGQFVTIFQDITERITAEQDLQKSYTQLEKANEKLNEMNRQLSNQVALEVEKRQKQDSLLMQQERFADMGHMISAIAHQWRQPLNGLGLILQTIQENCAGDEFTAELFDQGLSMVQHMSETIDDFRNFFKPNREKELFSVVHQVMSIYRLMSASFMNNDIQFIISCKCDRNEHSSINEVNTTMCQENYYTISGYPGEFKQVLMNIMSNARESLKILDDETSRGKRIIRTDIRPCGDMVSIAISNNGDHIPQENLKRIFEPYFTTRLHEGGTGIGLYMSKLIVEDHMKGTLTCRNEGEWVIFEIKFPRDLTLDQGASRDA